MLAFRALKLEEINSLYAQEGLEKNELNAFAKVFGEYHTNAQAKLTQSTKYSERNIAGNELARFFSALGFQTQIDQESGAQSVNSAIDLALLQNGSVKVIIEAKLPESISKNKQMFSAQNPNCKALHEAILYYLREVVDKQNFGVESIIITDFTRFFIFSYKEFERLFAKNAKIEDIFAKYKNDTSNFYAKAQGILEGLNDEICGVCVDLSSLAGLSRASANPAQSTKNQNPSQNATQSQNFPTNATQNLAINIAQSLTPKGKKSLETLCKIFHKDFLFGEFKQSNPLSPRFYNELLYILGLSEYKRDDNIFIEPSKESLDGANTLYHLIITQLQATHPSQIQNLDFVMQYIILWLNRILFLKLIEANLIRFNDDKNLAFLNKSKLKDYQALSHLFFEILAKEHSKRPKDSPLAYLPHLNSSLFERQECEEVLDISMLDNSAEFSYYATTQVRKEGKRQAGKVNLLSYIFEFLDAFDFGSGESDTNSTSNENEGEDSTIIEQKELIKTNVLGLVFEKLNGYKEGSFYTPNFITSYMCRISLEQVVLEKFNEANPKWNATNLSELAELIRDERERKDEFKAILRELRICDPSVGSGHFLVSALCEMIRIYHSLRLSDELNEYELKIDDDEIIIYVAKDKVFDYKKPTKPNENSQAVQKCLFHLKKSIIQNNLFGVDINPNSVEICKLRLWIELLKNSYYLTQESEGFDESLPESYHQMQTLPNIDINIKCGNSLISYLAINEPLPVKITEKIKTYQELEKDYFHAMYENRQTHINKIQNIKQELTNSYFKTKFRNKIESLIQKCDTYAKNFGNFGKESLSEHYKFLKENIHISSILAPSEDDINKAKAKKDLENLKKSHDEIFSLQGTFEWRIEFSKLLNAGLSTEQITKNNQSKIKGDTQNIVKNKKGDFMGFDLVIGNPPYGVKLSAEQRATYKDIYEISSTDTAQLFILLADKILSPKGVNSFIVPKALTFASNWTQIRSFLQSSLYTLADCGRAWSYVLLEMVIFARQKGKEFKQYRTLFLEDVKKKKTNNKDKETKTLMIDKSLIKLFNFYLNNLDNKELEIGLKMIKNKSFLGNYCENVRGITYQKHLIKKGKYAFVGGNEITRYSTKGIKGYSNNIQKLSKNAFIKDNSLLVQNIVAHIQNPKPHIKITAMIPHTKDIFLLDTINQLTFVGLDSKFAWAILSSTLINWYVYHFIFAKAIRTMHFDRPVTNKIPIPKLTTKNKKIADEITTLADKILEYKKQGKDTSDLESKIDDLVYSLYELTQDEIKIIESK